MDIYLSNIPMVKREQKGQSLISFPNSFTVIDLETTGLSPRYSHIIEMAAIKVRDNEIVDTFASLAGYDKLKICSFITEKTGITQDMINDAPKFIDVFPEYLNFISDDIVIGHNVNFDINFIYDNSEFPFANDYIDTMRISKRLHADFPHHRLCDLCDYYHIDHPSEHRSLNDCKYTLACFRALKEEVISSFGDFDSFLQSLHRKRQSKYVRASDIVASSDNFDKYHPLYGKECVFTGKLDLLTRKEAMQIVANFGGVNHDTVTKNTNFLILGNNDYCTSIKDGKSTKQKKAEKLILSGHDIEIMPESVFYDMVFNR